MRTRVVRQSRGRWRAGRGERAAGVLWTGAELVVTVGVLVLLLVVHQLWWTNREAHGDARSRVEELRQRWDGDAGGPGGSQEPSAPSSGPSVRPSPTAESEPEPEPTTRPVPDDAYAVLRLPKLGVTVPVAEGIDRAGVLNKGYAGHYPQTSGPGEQGNFALAGHRNTHGEPFRRLNLLGPGDKAEVETASHRYVYEVVGGVPSTLPGDGTVLDPVPRSSVHPGRRLDGPGNYLTLTTCTPEYTSTYRLVVWGRLTAVTPR